MRFTFEFVHSFKEKPNNMSNILMKEYNTSRKHLLGSFFLSYLQNNHTGSIFFLFLSLSLRIIISYYFLIFIIIIESCHIN